MTPFRLSLVSYAGSPPCSKFAQLNLQIHRKPLAGKYLVLLEKIMDKGEGNNPAIERIISLSISNWSWRTDFELPRQDFGASLRFLFMAERTHNSVGSQRKRTQLCVFLELCTFWSTTCSHNSNLELGRFKSGIWNIDNGCPSTLHQDAAAASHNCTHFLCYRCKRLRDCSLEPHWSKCYLAQRSKDCPTPQ